MVWIGGHRPPGDYRHLPKEKHRQKNEGSKCHSCGGQPRGTRCCWFLLGGAGGSRWFLLGGAGGSGTSEDRRAEVITVEEIGDSNANDDSCDIKGIVHEYIVEGRTPDPDSKQEEVTEHVQVDVAMSAKLHQGWTNRQKKIQTDSM